MDFNLLNDVLNSFDQAVAQWSAALRPVALSLFWGLATIEWAWTWVRLMISQRAGLDVVFETYLRKATYFAFLLLVIEKSDVLLPLIISSFQQAGGSASGITALHPSGFLSTGVTVAVELLRSLDSTGFLTYPLGVATAILGSLLTLLAFFFMAASIVVTLVESFVVIGATYVLLGFGASRWTYQLAEGAVSGVLRIAVKLMLTYLVAGVIADQTAIWAMRLLEQDPIGPLELYTFLGAVAAWAALLWSIPRLASQLVPPGIHFGLKPVVFDN